MEKRIGKRKETLFEMIRRQMKRKRDAQLPPLSEKNNLDHKKRTTCRFIFARVFFFALSMYSRGNASRPNKHRAIVLKFDEQKMPGIYFSRIKIYCANQTKYHVDSHRVLLSRCFVVSCVYSLLNGKERKKPLFYRLAKPNNIHSFSAGVFPFTHV